MVISREEFKELGKKYWFKIDESIYLAYVKDGDIFAVLDIENGVVSVKTKVFKGRPYADKIVNDVEELEKAVQTVLKNLKLENIRQKMNLIESDF